MNLLTEEHVGHTLTVLTMSGNKNFGEITYVDDDIVMLSFDLTDRDNRSGPKKPMSVKIRQDRIESVGELTQ